MTDNSDNSIVNIDKELIEGQAQAWFVRFKSSNISPADQADFKRWMQADSMHRIAYQELQNLWDMVGSFAEAPEIVAAREKVLRDTAGRSDIKSKGESKEESEKEPSLFARLFMPLVTRPWSVLAIAASALVMVITATQLNDIDFWSAPAAGDIYQTQVGERKTIVLADNSVVILDTDTRLVADYSQQKRLISLEKGQARFNVAHEPRRPFSVEAGDGVVTALGTTFVVRKTANDVLVTLIEGKVKVARQSQLMTISHTPDDQKDIARQLVYSKKGISKPDVVDIPQVTAWEQGRLVFDNHSLPEVIAELNRYSDKKIIIADRTLRAIRVTGVFNAGDNRSAIRALKTYFSMSLSTDQRGNFVLKSNTDVANGSDSEVEPHL